ncbi:MAG TPA: OmpA family protein, partial [Pseudomonadota bacterium]|nr:OmpA family protein [Pseudomonadota bacterium]
VPQGLQPDPQRLGCPAPDRDGDTVPDAVDACPDKPGAPSPNPKKNGCPGLVEIQGGLIKIYKKVYFKLNKADIDARSNELLASVAHTLTVTPAIKKVEVAGFADDTGDRVFNQDLTERRSQSVVLWLTAHGVAAERLYGKGYGAVPIDKTLSKKEQAKVREFNRRVEFRIVDPPQPAAPPAASPPPAPAPAAAKPAAAAAGVKKKAPVAPAKAKAPAPAKKPAPAAAP